MIGISMEGMMSADAALTKATYLMLKLAQEANLLALEVALEAAKGASTNDRMLQVAEEIKGLADQAMEVKDELLGSLLFRQAK